MRQDRCGRVGRTNRGGACDGGHYNSRNGGNWRGRRNEGAWGLWARGDSGNCQRAQAWVFFSIFKFPPATFDDALRPDWLRDVTLAWLRRLPPTRMPHSSRTTSLPTFMSSVLAFVPPKASPTVIRLQKKIFLSRSTTLGCSEPLLGAPIHLHLHPLILSHELRAPEAADVTNKL